MDSVFDMSLVKRACSEIFDGEASAAGDLNGGFHDIDLFDTQINILADKISILPDSYQEALISRMCFGLSAEETGEIFGMPNPSKIFNSAQITLGYSLALKPGERISSTSLKKACNFALSAFVAKIKEEAAQQPEFQNKKKMKRFLQWHKHNKMSLARLFLKRAVIFVVGVLLFGITAFTVNAAIQKKFFNWVVSVYEKFSSFSIAAGNETNVTSPIGDSKQISFGYVPEGFELTKENGGYRRINLQYNDQNGMRIFLTVTASDGTKQGLNTEDAVIEEIYINGQEALFWIKNETTFIVWEQQGYLFSLITELNRETAVKIAENIHFDDEQ